ncbi:hypothetical protein I7X12_13180 [Halosimplex litoreum]|uniref:Uncharacterized protein n=1 Tax=Halosimplex litoreum TaxID=1198301 RepID=A0A7T3FW15_9EURY|nr:hypothetical protein [Halosimplex litoreum]QPV61701.1 hypothetical protein I7X12_13180 [Halosimplex litoreum]
MQRRTLLGLAGTAGVVGALGATARVADQPSAPPATYAEEPVPPAGKRNSPVVVSDTTTAGSETYGTVLQDASVLDLEPTDRYALVTRYRLIPGSNYRASSGWKTASLTVEHDWQSGSIVSHSGDVVPADDDDTDSNLYLDTDQLTRGYRWNLTFDSATGNSSTVRFATVVDCEGTPETGDGLVDATFGAGFTKGFLRTSEQDRATARVVMQGTNK